MTDGKHVLYLFGAGASAEAIPVAKKLPKDMKKIAGKLKKWHQNIPQVSPEIIARARERERARARARAGEIAGEIARAIEIEIEIEIEREIQIEREIVSESESERARAIEKARARERARAEIICTDLEDLADKVKNFKKSTNIECTVDKYLSSLSKQSLEENNYEKSKNTLAIYILLKQFFNTDENIQLDDRYGAWLRNIVPDRKQEKFENNIRCLTWDYDMQMELAYYQYFLREKPRSPCEIINAFSYPQPFSGLEKQPQLGIHLNGIVLLKKLQNKIWYDSFAKILNDLFDTTRGHNHAKNKFSPSGWGSKFLMDLLRLSQDCTLQFHWDWQNSNRLGTDAAFDRTKLEKAIVEHKILENAACVVVVGYSFPGYNEDMDRKIIRSIKNSRLTMYIQDRRAEAVRERIIQQFELSEEYQKRIIPITETSSFFIPDMLIPEN